MALSPAKRHFLKTTAALEAAAAAPAAFMDGATSYEMTLAKLQQDQWRLKQIQSGEAKGQLKSELLPDYVPYIEGVLQAGQGAQDDVVVTIMVWRFDAGDFDGGLDVAAYVLQHGLKMPDRFNRTTGCVVAEEVATAALKAQRAGESFSRDTLTRTAELTADYDMPDEARAKLMLALGKATLEGLDDETPGQPGQIAAGIELLKRAIELHGACGGKTDLGRAERLLKIHAGTTG